MRRPTTARLAAAALTTLAATTTATPAHEDLDRQIAAVTTRISASPASPDLYARRAGLHHAHRDFPAARADFTHALSLDPHHVPARVGLAAVELAAGHPEAALPHATRATRAAPDDPTTHRQLARVFASLGRRDACHAAFNHARSLHDAPPADLFSEHAASLESLDPPDRTTAAAVLEAGIKHLGPLVTLVTPLTGLYLQLGQPDDALAAHDLLAPSLGTNPRWITRRADLLEQAGHPTDARRTYLEARATLARLNPRRRNTSAMLELATHVEHAIARLTPTQSSSP